MEADCVSGSCPRKIPAGQKFSVAIERDSPTTFVWKNVISLLRSITLRAEGIRLLSCKLSAATFTWTLSFGIYRKIVLGPQKPSFENIAALVFQSTNLKTDEIRLFFLVVLRKIFFGT